MSNPIANSKQHTEIAPTREQARANILTCKPAALIEDEIRNLLVPATYTTEVAGSDDNSTIYTPDVFYNECRPIEWRNSVYAPPEPPRSQRSTWRSTAPNRGVAATTGPLLVFLCGDDLKKSDRIGKGLKICSPRTARTVMGVALVRTGASLGSVVESR